MERAVGEVHIAVITVLLSILGVLTTGLGDMQNAGENRSLLEGQLAPFNTNKHSTTACLGLSWLAACTLVVDFTTGLDSCCIS